MASSRSLLRQRDETAFAQLVEKYHTSLARLFVRNDAVAEGSLIPAQLVDLLRLFRGWKKTQPSLSSRVTQERP